MRRFFFIACILFFSHYSFAQKKADTLIRKKADTALQKSKDTALNINKDTVVSTKPVTALKNPKIVYGIASFYSRSLDGSKTATGETFRQTGMTAASNFFKLNTWVRVTNLRTGKSIIVRINDRMHPSMAKKGRVVDLSRKGATILDFIVKGLIKVKMEEVPKGTLE
ncbi:MAG: septal ring lytic transglycosylase RlpA family protein [Bacteroidetes bacterium]|nr:septal ring lytic transglycosylase RlpA family protein [Bacteroidota bacterium]